MIFLNSPARLLICRSNFKFKPLFSKMMSSSYHHHTLKTLTEIGVKVEWKQEYQLSVPISTTTNNHADQKKTIEYLVRLADQGKSIAEAHLMGSLLAGPDNETDDSVDIPLLLGKPDSTATPEVDWVLSRLGIKNHQLIIRESVKTTDNLTPEKQQPWVLSRLPTENATSIQSDKTELESLITNLKPRLSVEVITDDHPNKSICILVGLVPQSDGVWGGLISYRIST
ncbi:hypothetical protein MJO28_007365 [Puccinia striiformis f. sp. tritici]|uniref:Uncharacterized protein n=1 Tax=Puccinia striiformis f. sp. tritici TaxID=168172 RepID=A0ACC0EED0_9BASI|nr:hypothetical protein MJO28_007365 [Puccinia striiformis f. sp. tritici]